MSVTACLDRIRTAPFVLDSMAEADALAAAAGASTDGARTTELLFEAARDLDDQVTGIAAVHALARVSDDSADRALSALLSHERAFLREHAAWALGARLPHLDAIGRLVAVVVSGGFAGMVAQRTLQRWSDAAADHVALALEGALAGTTGSRGDDVPVRTRLTETLGLVPGPLPARMLRQLASDRLESVAVRAAAVAALGDLGDPADVDLLAGLTAIPGELGSVARLALIDLDAATSSPIQRASSGDGPLTTVAQLFLHADIDPELSQSGTGDNGGIATLLVRLSDALVRTDAVDRVITVSRGTPQQAVAAMTGGAATRQWFVPVPLDPDATGINNAWPSRIAAERGIRRALRAAGPVAAVHLRMADVGSLAAHSVASELGIPVVFTLAPDPHGVIHALDMTGALARDEFGDVDQREHYWFRTRLVSRLADVSAHRVLFPRPDVRRELHELLGLDVDAEPDRSTVVPEGIDLGVTEAAAADVAAADTGDAARPAIAQLRDLVAKLPAHRHGLPLAISVGRLHRVKGMATVAEAWAADAELRDRCNLVIVGGDLEDPTADEQSQLDRIAAVVDAHPEAADGLVLAGHRPNDVVARWLAMAARGSSPLIAPHGAYVCGSLKEEFGLALLEALAAGLPVVAPHGGGPATYVEAGVTGVLVDTRQPSEVAAGMHAALDIAPTDGRRERALATVRDRFTIEAMARSLAAIYAAVDERRAGTGMRARSRPTTTSSNSSRASSPSASRSE